MAASATSEESWDYVIVGGGTAGCVLANRLSEDPACRVLMLEAGGRGRDLRIEVPLFLPFVLGRPRFDWCWSGAPEPHLNGRVLALPRGKVLGGSSAINGMVYVRGAAYDFDHWAEQGNPGWSWAEVLPYFKRSEDWQNAPLPAHGTGGEWEISDPEVRWEALDAYADAAEAAGIPKNDDYNSGEMEGVGYFHASISRGTRQTAAKAFLRPALGRPNLVVRTGALVNELLLDGKRVTGVRYSRGGRTQTVRAGREVILAAGAYASPAILERSGIGQPERLKALGITPLHELPGVGENLQDHWHVRVRHRLRGTLTLNDWVRHPIRKLRLGGRYIFTRKGPLGAPPALLAAFVRTDPALPAPDVEIHIAPASYQRVGGPMDEFSGITSSLSQARPESRGYVHITSAGAEAVPAIVHNYLSTKADMDAAVGCIRLVRRIAAAEPLQRFAPEEVAPGPLVDSREAIEAFARETLATTFHPVGTCKMGVDDMAVVTPELRVCGLEGLRVVDASVMPTIPTGNTQAPVVMVAEKAADMIRGRTAPAAAA